MFSSIKSRFSSFFAQSQPTAPSSKITTKPASRWQNEQDLQEFHERLEKGLLTRDQALVWIGHVFGSGYGGDLIDWYFVCNDGTFSVGDFSTQAFYDQAALLNHLECQMGR